MKYGILTIDTRTSNRGNRLIEYAMKKFLNLPEPLVSVSMFIEPSPVQIAQLNTCQFVLLPGATILAANDQQGKAMRFLDRIKVPKFCCAASGWKPKYHLNKEALKHIDGPIGARDPDTLKECQALGRDAIMVGCPTAFLPPARYTPNPAYDVIGFARTYTAWQTKLFRGLKKKKLVASIQEEKFEKPLLFGITDQAVYYDKPEDVYHTYGGASVVYTGRLHGVLPAISQRCPVGFFGELIDSRFTLLEYLGIEICPIGTDANITLCYPDTYRAPLAALKEAMVEWRKKTIGLVA